MLRGRGVAQPGKQNSCKHWLFPQLLALCWARSRKGELLSRDAAGSGGEHQRWQVLLKKVLPP